MNEPPFFPELRDFEWTFVPAVGLECVRWSRGVVQTRADLYSPAIFGATEDYRCACGLLAGEGNVGRTCAQCQVMVVSNAGLGLKTRIARMPLGLNCRHPWARQSDIPGGWIRELLVAPIAYRVGPHGEPNVFGRKYEALLEETVAIRAELGKLEPSEVPRQKAEMDTSRLDRIIETIFGTAESRRSEATEGSLITLIADGLATFDRGTPWLLRSAMLTIHLQTRV